MPRSDFQANKIFCCCLFNRNQNPTRVLSLDRKLNLLKKDAPDLEFIVDYTIYICRCWTPATVGSQIKGTQSRKNGEAFQQLITE